MMALASIALVFEVVRTLFGREGFKEFADGGVDRIDGSCGCPSEQTFELGNDLLDRVQVG
jgi:hypothetical protein